MGNSNWRRRFLAYHPFLTYSPDNSGAIFLLHDGAPAFSQYPDLGAASQDLLALHRLGKSAIQLLPQHDNSKEFDATTESYFDTVEDLAPLLTELVREGKIVFHGDARTDDIDWIDEHGPSGMVSIAWSLARAKGEFSEDVPVEVFTELFSISCLLEIDNALIGKFLDGRGALSAAIAASDAYANALALSTKDERLQSARKALAMQAAISRHVQDPKQKEKRFVRECWGDWRDGKRHYKNKAEFARDMIAKCENLVSVRKIEDWVRIWDRQASTDRNHIDE